MAAYLRLPGVPLPRWVRQPGCRECRLLPRERAGIPELAKRVGGGDDNGLRLILPDDCLHLVPAYRPDCGPVVGQVVDHCVGLARAQRVDGAAPDPREGLAPDPVDDRVMPVHCLVRQVRIMGRGTPRPETEVGPAPQRVRRERHECEHGVCRGLFGGADAYAATFEQRTPS